MNDANTLSLNYSSIKYKLPPDINNTIEFASEKRHPKPLYKAERKISGLSYSTFFFLRICSNSEFNFSRDLCFRVCLDLSALTFSSSSIFRFS